MRELIINLLDAGSINKVKIDFISSIAHNELSTSIYSTHKRALLLIIYKALPIN